MDWAVAGATMLLVFVGYWQISAIRTENRLERTLSACCRYESDQVIEGSVRELRKAQRDGSFQSIPEKYEHEIVMILNYLDTLAIGIKQRVYDERLARDHTAAIIRHYADAYLNEEVARKVGFDVNNYHCLCELAKTWSIPNSYFRRSAIFSRTLAIFQAG